MMERGIRYYGNWRNKRFMFCHRRIIKEGRGGRGMFAFSLQFLTLLLLCFFFLDPSTMDEMRTSPNKKSDNGLNWIRMLGWMDVIQQEWIKCG